MVTVKESNRNETPIKSNINCEKYTIYNYVTKQKSFLKNLKKLITTHLHAEGGDGDHAPSISFFVKPAIQNRNVQPGEFLGKMRGHVRYGCPN